MEKNKLRSTFGMCMRERERDRERGGERERGREGGERERERARERERGEREREGGRDALSILAKWLVEAFEKNIKASEVDKELFAYVLEDVSDKDVEIREKDDAKGG
ncbi:hypothetical protein DPMN_079308 [Dreissena polymorpha]|uniref:Uncharacterized protein n=1 Tax=Dreissena polymorpha TaxID=45954 RepID=A0A9D4BSW0_DREPO|nr:hypothetical protein DPMN_079308 [Dreissena polymorpha]